MNLFTDIETTLTAIEHGWTSIPKAQCLAAMVTAIRPEVSIEIGVFAGKGLAALALAHKSIGHGIAIGVDPYSVDASVAGQVNPADAGWWTQLDHESIYKEAIGAIERFQLQPYCRLARSRSQDFDIPDNIGVLRIDGNHGEQALNDVERYCPKVVRGGFVMLDDIGWAGNAVSRAAVALGSNPEWRKLYDLEDAAVFQRL